MIVLDTNIIVDHLLFWNDEFYKIYEQNHWLAPEFLKSELAQVLWKQRKEFKIDQLIEFWHSGIALIDNFYSDEFYAESALKIAIKYDHAYYDAAFIAIAKLTNSAIMTNDKKMISIAKKQKIEII